jgi:hypothetical protein
LIVTKTPPKHFGNVFLRSRFATPPSHRGFADH